MQTPRALKCLFNPFTPHNFSDREKKTVEDKKREKKQKKKQEKNGNYQRISSSPAKINSIFPAGHSLDLIGEKMEQHRLIVTPEEALFERMKKKRMIKTKERKEDPLASDCYTEMTPKLKVFIQ